MAEAVTKNSNYHCEPTALAAGIESITLKIEAPEVAPTAQNLHNSIPETTSRPFGLSAAAE